MDTRVDDVLSCQYTAVDLVRCGGEERTYQVLGTVHLGVGIHDGGAIAAAVIGAHLGCADEVVAAGHFGDDVRGGSVLLDGVGGVLEVVEEFLQERCERLLVLRCLQQGVGFDGCGAGGVDAQDAGGGGAVREVQFHGDDAVAAGAAGGLVEAGDTVAGDVRGPELQAVAALGEDAGAAGVHALRKGVGGGDDAGGVEGCEVGAGADFDGEHGVVFEVVADWEVDPVLLRGKSDSGAAALDGLELLGGANARVEEDARCGQSTGSEDDLATRTDPNDLNTARGVLDLDTADVAASADQTADCGLQTQGEVVLVLDQREVGAYRTSSDAIGDRPGRVAERLVLLVGLLVLINGLPSEAAQKGRQHGVHALIISATVSRWEQASRVSLVEAGSGTLDILPLPPGRPLVVKVRLLWVNQGHRINNGAATQNTSSHAGCVFAQVIPNDTQAGQCLVQGRDIDGRQGLVPRKSVRGTHLDCRGDSTLDEQNALVCLSQAFRSHDTRRTTSHDDVVVCGVRNRRGHAGDRTATRGRDDGRRRGRSARGRSAGRLGHGSPGGVPGGLGLAEEHLKAAEASGMVCQSRSGRGRSGRAGLAEGPAKEVRFIAGVECRWLSEDAATAKESIGEMSAVERCALGDLGKTGVSAVYFRVGVVGCLAQTRDNRVTIRPGRDQKSRGHRATQTDTAPSFRAVQRYHQLTDKVGPYGLREG